MIESIQEIKLNAEKRESCAPYLRGPIPLSWLSAAAKLPGKSLHVGVSLWFLRGVTKNLIVRFNQNDQERYGVKRDAARRGIQALEKAGLITVQRESGKRLLVTIVSASPGNAGGISEISK